MTEKIIKFIFTFVLCSVIFLAIYGCAHSFYINKKLRAACVLSCKPHKMEFMDNEGTCWCNQNISEGKGNK